MKKVKRKGWVVKYEMLVFNCNQGGCHSFNWHNSPTEKGSLEKVVQVVLVVFKNGGWRSDKSD